MKAILVYILALTSTLIIGILVWIITYNIAFLISPPYIIVDNHKRGLIPTGQIFTGAVVSMISMFILDEPIKLIRSGRSKLTTYFAGEDL